MGASCVVMSREARTSPRNSALRPDAKGICAEWVAEARDKCSPSTPLFHFTSSSEIHQKRRR